jgi:hypothetical protein
MTTHDRTTAAGRAPQEETVTALEDLKTCIRIAVGTPDDALLLTPQEWEQAAREVEARGGCVIYRAAARACEEAAAEARLLARGEFPIAHDLRPAWLARTYVRDALGPLPAPEARS